MLSMTFGLGVLLLVIGLTGAIWPTEVTQYPPMDAIGDSQQAVERLEQTPTKWSVRITRTLCIGLLTLGLWLIAS